MTRILKIDEMVTEANYNKFQLESERKEVYALTDAELVSQLEDYVQKYYTEFPDDYQDDKAEGESYLNWGEFEYGYDTIVANYVCDLINLETDGVKLSRKDQDIIEMAWRIANEYLKK